MYLAPNLASSRTVTSTAGGFPDGTWFAIPAGPPCPCLELPVLVSSHTSAMTKRAAIATAWFRYRRGREKPLVSEAVLEPRVGNGVGFEDLREGYGRCIVVVAAAVCDESLGM